MKKLFAIIMTIMLLFPLRVNALETTLKDGSNILSDSKKSELEEYIEKGFKKANIPGMSVVIVKDGETIYEEGFGYTDVNSKKEVTDETVFELGSNSKAFTGLAILQLAKDGLIDLNAPVNEYIPWLNLKYKGETVSVTVEEFLHQTSGIPYASIDKIPISESDNALEETVKILNEIELDRYPGKSFEYATINYDVLGLIIEKVTEKSYEEYIKENILEPLTLNETYLSKKEVPQNQMASGHKLGFFKQHIYEAPTYKGNVPAGYFMSNSKDIAKWLKIQLGTLEDINFDKELINNTHIPNRRVKPLSDGSSYAAGWFSNQSDEGEYQHGGDNPNYSSYMIFRPGEKIGIAVLCNARTEYAEKITKGINNILLGNSIEENSKDFNKTVDLGASVICIIASLLIVVIMYLSVKSVVEIIQKKRRLKKISAKNIAQILLSLIFISLVAYCLYKIPSVFGYGVSWGFAFIWMPITVKYALSLLVASIVMAYLYFALTWFFPKKKDKSLFQAVFLSTISGFGNALIIFVMNTAIQGSSSLRLNLIIYFVLGIVMYVYGQRLVRIKLIEISNNIVYNKRVEIIDKILNCSFNEFERISDSKIQTTLNNDTETISRSVNIIVSGLTNLIVAACCFIYLGVINKYGLLLSLAIIFVIAGIYFLAGRHANKIGEETRDIQNIFFNFINDLISGFKELILNKNKREEFSIDMKDKCNMYKTKRVRYALAFADMFVIGELLFTVAIGAVVFLFPLVFKTMDLSTLTSYVFILLYITGPVNGILDAIPSALEVKISYQRINDFINGTLELASSDIENVDLEKQKNITLQLNNIEYKYDNAEKNEFKIGPIDYTFKSGEIVFITGGNGSGKSSLAKVLTGLYIPTEGHITINGQVIEGKALSEYYTTVFSDFHLFNKLYGINYKDKENEIKENLAILQMDKKVEIKDGVFSTIKLSTGQKKRLALLISYLEDKQIYLFDEWAADQDPEFRRFFYETLLPALREKGKCVIAITHDDHYFNIADKVIKMEMGKIQK